MTEPERLSLTIALDTLRHLGMNLYSSLPPVLSELVANSYDARARKVSVSLGEDEVIIEDDGIGMGRSEMQEKYLVVGRDRRKEDGSNRPSIDPFPEWPVRGKPMGRKGIGKLAMFSMASEVEIQSIQMGRRAAIVMRRDEIEAAASKKQPYLPKEIPGAADLKIGTRITLRHLKRQRSISPGRVVKSIARRFSVLGTADFSIQVDGNEIVVADWDIFSKIQYLWYLGAESAVHAKRVKSGIKCVQVDAVVPNPTGAGWSITGWIGTVEKPDQLKAVVDGIDFNDNRIVIDCRGKVAIANFLHQFGESGVYASYLCGYIRADYLDDSDEDIATSDRERMQDDDPRVEALKSYMRTLLKRIQKEWTENRRETAAKQAEVDPIISDWLATLEADEKDDARKLLGRLGGVRYSEESDRAQVQKYAILAFERLRARHNLHLLRDSDDDNLATIAAMFALEGDLESALYADIASQRLEILRELEGLVDGNVKEKVIQKHIFDNLWLLEPSWTSNDHLTARLEQRVSTEFGAIKLTKEEEEGRPDIRYRRAGGVHIVIELKRPNIKKDAYELLRQVKKYKSALAKCLLEVDGERSPNIQCVCLVGHLPEIGPDEEGALLAAGTRILTFDQIINDSCKRFAEYLNAQKKFGRIQTILQRLDESSGVK